MGEAGKETTTVNVKGVSVSAWARCRSCHAKTGETAGAWLSRAIDQLANLEAGERLILPGQPVAQPAKPTGMPVADVVALLQGMAALTAATGVRPAVRDVRRLYALVDDRTREGRGLGPRPVRISRGKSLAIEGIAGTIEG